MNTTKLHPMIASGEIFLVAGVYDALSAKLAERAGFHAVVVKRSRTYMRAYVNTEPPNPCANE